MENSNAASRLGIVILAAGRSRRMGRPKLLLPWGATSVLGHQIGTWRALGAGQIAVVCANGDDALNGELDRLRFPATDRIGNPDAEQGMFSSIRCATKWSGWSARLTQWAITLGDQPHLQMQTLRALLNFAEANPNRVCQPRRLGHLRHPVILPKSFIHELAGTSAPTLKDFLKTIPEHLAAFDADDAGLDLDLDTPEDYQRALALFRDE